ncbi:ANM_HP_G0168090.mRNA.1.CDS.1 [Saccharomyces cerevisiae]|nr:ANM_HP_G0168090.mRNA.1.CDS.1 [Saccharomyces cerevisiae]CAI6924224.1 ANM_HP_G0168090.mRNA.1.CDS.1 [Saccharomyces cerevisiae]
MVPLKVFSAVSDTVQKTSDQLREPLNVQPVKRSCQQLFYDVKNAPLWNVYRGIIPVILLLRLVLGKFKASVKKT